MTTKTPSRFAAWQEGNQVRREAIIDEYLEYGFYDPNASTVRVTIGDKPKCLEHKHDK